MYHYAQQFDAFLKGALDDDDQAKLFSACQVAGNDNPFCYAVLNRESFEQKRKEQRLKNRPPRRRHSPAARPRFNARAKLLNWNDLRGARLPALIRGFASLPLEEVHQVEHAAFAETDCPNNAAIATAVTLEDFLPDGSPFEVIGRLYEKGGQCITDNPADREQILTRAGLFYYAIGDYASAAEAFLKSTKTTDAFIARPLYWLYRSRIELGDDARAEQALDELKARYPFSFHTLVALTAAHQDPGQILLRSGPHQSRRSQAVQALNPLIEDVELLHKFRFNDSATRVLDWAVLESTGVEPEVMIYLAELKKEQGDYQAKISILSDVLYNNPSLISRETMELYFPKVFFPIFQKHSSQIDPYLLLAIARRESAFDVRAVSPANARGLLQVTPATGRHLAHHPNLFNAEQNVDIGTRYLLQLLEKTDGQIHMALAAYNAGFLKLSAWTERYAVDDSILFIDLIPYRETREYVASILRNYYWYRRIHQGDDSLTPQRLLELARSPVND